MLGADARRVTHLWPTMSSSARTRKFRTGLIRPDPAAVVWIKRVCIGALAIHLVFASWSLYRRLWQVLHIEVASSSAVLTPGATVSYDVVTSGEVHNRIRLELVQGAHAETVREERTRVSAISAYDPRIFRYERTMVLTAELLARFEPGPATLRLTGFGGQKLLRTPAPRVKELAVQIAR
jgi:hypothetical protein